MDTVVVGLRVVLSLGVVLALLWVLQKRLVKGGRAGSRAQVRAAGECRAAVARQPVLGAVGQVEEGMKDTRMTMLAYRIKLALYGYAGGH